MRTLARKVTAPSPASGRLLQRACACGQHTMGGGDCDQCREASPASSGPSALPPRLVVGSADDSAEHEADRVAEAVTRATDRAGGPGGSLRERFERTFGRDFSRVRVHTDPAAAASAVAVGARAYTVGSDIVFGPGEPTPDARGRRLLAHELTHVLQQGAHGGGEHGVTLRRTPLPGTAWDEAGRKQRPGVLTGRRPGDPLPYREATDLAECLRIMGPDSGEYCRQEVLGEAPPPPVLGGSKAFGFSLGETAGKRSVQAFYFPGQTDERALIVGGVHGSELAGIEVAEILKEDLRNAPVKPYFSVVLVPVLFPDNRAVAEAAWQRGTRETNTGRYSPGKPNEKLHDPNRLYPKAGEAFDPARTVAASGVAMEPETIMLLKLIDEFHPTRVAALHSTHDPAVGGFYADPRTDAAGKAKGFDPDEALALAIADRAEKAGAKVPGNRRGVAHEARYPEDPAIADPGKTQPRDTEKGTSSFGGWASSDVKGGRPAMTVITMEIDTATPSALASNPAQRLKELQARSIALREVFLGPKGANSPP